MQPNCMKSCKTLSHDLEGSDEGVWADDRGDNKVLIIPITSNRGLCGAFNMNVVKEAVGLINKKYSSQLKAGKFGYYVYR